MTRLAKKIGSMRKAKGILAFALCISLLAFSAATPAMAADSEVITVSLRIEGLEGTLYYNKQVDIAAEATVTALLTAVNGMEGSPEITITEVGFGSYVSDVNGLSEFAHGGMSGWSYRVNGESPTVGIDDCILESHDEVVCFYGDPFGIGMQYPLVDISRLRSGGIIRFTSIDTTYDEQWNPIYTENPVDRATVTFDGLTRTTNDDGEITLPDSARLPGFRSLRIERYDEETGVPTVLRFASDYVIYVPLGDTPKDDLHGLAAMFLKALFQMLLSYSS